MPSFKYHDKLAAFSDCPASDCREDSRDGCRFVFRERMADSFKPVGDPSRSAKWADDRERCGGWALSFFTSVEIAHERFKKIQSSSRNIHKKIGDSIASGRLQHGDGVMTPTDSEGHFELHEYEDTNLVTRFTVVRELV